MLWLWDFPIKLFSKQKRTKLGCTSVCGYCCAGCNNTMWQGAYSQWGMYTVSKKKVNPCIHCHNSGKQCRIITEFWSDNAISNCKQITKLKVKSLNACNSYSWFCEVIPKTIVSTIGNCTDIRLSKCSSVQISNIIKVCVQNVLRVLKCKLEDVDATAWSLHRWTPGGNVPTLRSGMTSAHQHHASGCDASPTSGSLPHSGQDCWLATELERWSLVFHKLTAARSRAPCGQERCPVEK